MTPKQFRGLKPGDLVRHKSKGSRAHIVHGNYGDRVTAVRTVDLTNPSEWDHVREEGSVIADFDSPPALEWVIKQCKSGYPAKLTGYWEARLFKNGKAQKLSSSRYAGRQFLVNILKATGIPVRNPKPTPEEEKWL